MTRTEAVLAYLVAERRNPYSDYRFSLQACAPGSQRTFKVTAPGLDEAALPRPFAHAGHLLAFVYISTDDTGPDFSQGSAIRLIDVRSGKDVEPTGPSPGGYTFVAGTGPDFFGDDVDNTWAGPAPAVSLVATRGGAVAWTSCQSIEFNGLTNLLYRCFDGGPVSVWEHLPGAYWPTRLDEGAIPPRSLQLHGDRLSWTHHGGRRHATL